MSRSEAEAFLDRAEQDDALRGELAALDDPDAVLERARTAGFDVGREDFLAAFTERYGVELTPEQLDAIAAGGDAADLAVWSAVGSGLGPALAGVRIAA